MQPDRPEQAEPRESQERLERPARKDPAGKTGATGPTGPAGAKGVTGATGTTGATGQPGKEGSKGETGPTGQAGTAAIASFASSQSVSNGYCLNYTAIEGKGQGPCPGKTSGYSGSELLAGPRTGRGRDDHEPLRDDERNSGQQGIGARLRDRQHKRSGASLLHGQLGEQGCLLERIRIGHGGSWGLHRGQGSPASAPAGAPGKWRVTFRY